MTAASCFALTQSSKDLHFYIYDVAPRIGGGTNVHMDVGHPYGNSLYRTNMSTGRRQKGPTIPGS